MRIQSCLVLDKQRAESPFQQVAVPHFDTLCLVLSVISVISVVQWLS